MQPETVVEDKPVLAWDTYVTEADRLQVESFRSHEWRRLERELLREQHWAIVPGVEPCWVSPGVVVFWKPVLDREGEVKEWVEISGKQVNTPSQFAHYLNKGFRLRPPLEGVEAEVFQVDESALPPEPSIAPPLPPQFLCSRHPKGDVYASATWDAYIDHCERYREPLELEPPAEVMEHLMQFSYVCVAHNLGFNSEDLAFQHVKEEMRKTGRPIHLTVTQMDNRKVAEHVHEYDGRITGALCKIDGCRATRKIDKIKRRHKE